MKYYKKFTFMSIDIDCNFELKYEDKYYHGCGISELEETLNNKDIYPEIEAEEDRYYKLFCHNLVFLKYFLPIEEVTIESEDKFTNEIKIIKYKKFILVDFEAFAGFKMKNIDKFLSEDQLNENKLDKMNAIFDSRLYLYKSPLSMPETFSGFVQRELNLLKLPTLFHNRLPYNEDTFETLLKLPRAGCYGMNREHRNKYIDNVYNYDINTAHIYQICSKEYPEGKCFRAKNLTVETIDKLISRDWMFVATLNIKVISKLKGDDHLGIIGETQELTYTSNIWKYIFENYEYQIVDVIDIAYYTKKSLLPENLISYLKDKYEIKKNSKGAKRAYAKLSLNIVFGLFFRKKEHFQHSFPMIVGAYTLAYTSEQLLKAMDTPGLNVVYWDTDGFYSTTPCDELVLGEEMGEFKLEEGPIKYFNIKQYWFNEEFKMSGLNGELAKEYYEESIPMSGDMIPPEYTGKWHFDRKKKKFILDPFKIDSKEILKRRLSKWRNQTNHN